MNNYELLLGIAEGRMRRFPDGNEKFRTLARILEEAGELAQAVNHLEGAGSKAEKPNRGSREQIAGEAVDLIENVLSLLIQYDMFEEFDYKIDESYSYLERTGFVRPPISQIDESRSNTIQL